MSGKSNVISFRGITRLDLPPDDILKASIGKLDSVVILGYDKEGEEYFASSIADEADVLWLLERAKQRLLSVTVDDF